MHQEIILWAIIIAILGSAITYIVVQKRKGVKCIGCGSEAKCCSSSSNDTAASCDCASQKTQEYSCACQQQTSPCTCKNTSCG